MNAYHHVHSTIAMIIDFGRKSILRVFNGDTNHMLSKMFISSEDTNSLNYIPEVLYLNVQPQKKVK